MLTCVGNLLCQNKKELQESYLSCSSKKYGTSTPVQGMQRIYFLSEKNKVTFLPIKNKTYAALFLKKWQEILHYPLQLQSLSVSTILTYLLLLNQVCRFATFKTALRSATEPFRFL
ncbi:hypothetical protein [Paenibacillus elgii]|uniref:hypothetical protein n=1 Tax=Paenibacillus elgii TaxID=189691 RepID=UPI00204242B4|nr:hypothetical protein [Paenibacillus elgii]MCM3272771.1 hypothetical protein [Paenibacillus elgii]